MAAVVVKRPPRNCGKNVVVMLWSVVQKHGNKCVKGTTNKIRMLGVWGKGVAGYVVVGVSGKVWGQCVACV